MPYDLVVWKCSRKEWRANFTFVFEPIKKMRGWILVASKTKKRVELGDPKVTMLEKETD